MTQKIPVISLEGKHGLLPLFVDIGVDIIQMGMFRWKSAQVFSYFPILVQPRNYPNLYISSLDNVPGYSKIKHFDPYKYKPTSEKVLFHVPPSSSREELGKYMTSVLNPIGVGVFYLGNSVQGCTTEIYEHKLRKAPYSMEMVERLIYQPRPGDRDWDPVTFHCLEMLMYKLKPAALPGLDFGNRLRDLFIFRYLILQFPPLGLHAEKKVENLDECQGEWVLAIIRDTSVVCKTFSVRVGEYLFTVPFVSGTASFLCPKGSVTEILVDGEKMDDKVGIYRTNTKYEARVK